VEREFFLADGEVDVDDDDACGDIEGNGGEVEDADDAGERNEPGAFVRSTNFKVKAKFDVQGADPTTVKVWAEGEVGAIDRRLGGA
jgi:hypothetical protein